MPYVAWNCARGEAAPATLPCADVVAISPADESVDTNVVVITGAGTISSFGDSPHMIQKYVTYDPTGTIVVKNSLVLNLLSGQQRSISKRAYAIYRCAGNNIWTETSFAQEGTASLMDLMARLDALEYRLNDLEMGVNK